MSIIFDTVTGVLYFCCYTL